MMELTFYGHSCFSISLGGKKYLFDPFISGNELAKDIDIKKIEADYILVSHGHGDHVTDLLPIAHNTGALVIAAFEVAEWVKAQGYERVHGMNFGSYQFDFGRVSFVPAWHSSVLPDGTYGANPGGFVVATEHGNFYYSGDTCLMMDMQLIPHYAQPDVAIMPVGGNFTMDAADALIASDFIKCNKVVGVHFDTFGYIKIDHDKSKEMFSKAGKELILPEIGATIRIKE
jgi:L-ascorbate metabolism protein UlaG (beta-lactamase superfamily)